MEKLGIDCNITVTKDFRLVCQREPSFNHAIPRSISAFGGSSLEEFYWLSTTLWPRVPINRSRHSRDRYRRSSHGTAVRVRKWLSLNQELVRL